MKNFKLVVMAVAVLGLTTLNSCGDCATTEEATATEEVVTGLDEAVEEAVEEATTEEAVTEEVIAEGEEAIEEVVTEE